MKALVLGAGMMGKGIAYDLVHSPTVEEIILADIDSERANHVANSLDTKVKPKRIDISFYDDVVELMSQVDVAIGATSYNHNFLLTKAAIEAGIHYCDLGGNMEVVDRQISLHERATRTGVCIIPNCGLAPGLACIIAAEGTKQFSTVDEIYIRVGGLPQHPKPPLNYQLVFTPEGLINEYLEPAEIISNGALKRVQSLTDLEELEFPPPLGTLEAFNTSGGVSTLTRMFRGKVNQLNYKTIRYRGHCEKFKTLFDLGFAESNPIMVGEKVLTAREFFESLLRNRLPTNGPDIVLMRVLIKGIMDNTPKTLAYEMVDYYDKQLGMTSMMRTTAFPTSIIAQMIVNGTITARGIMPPEQCVPLHPFMTELQKRNIIIKEALR